MSEIKQLSMKEYLELNAYRSGDIVAMSRSFAYWHWLQKNPDKAGRPLVVGCATHQLLEAEITGNKELIKGVEEFKDGSWRTKAFEKYAAERPLTYCVDSDEFALCHKMVKALLDEPEVMSYLKDSIAEATIVGNWPGTDVKCKVRSDYLHKKKAVSINIKTSLDVSESGFIHSTKDWAYDWQSGFHTMILSDQFKKSFDEVHICVEKTEGTEPCPIAIRSFGDDTIGWARSQMFEIISRIPDCEKTGIWPKKRANLHVLEIPQYARRLAEL